MATICFFARVASPEVLDRVEFYAQDIQLLRDLGHNVNVVTRVKDLRPADLYFIWWWTWAAFPMSVARLLRRPTIVTGVFDPWAFDDRPAYQRVLMRYALKHASANTFVALEEFREVTAKFDAPRSSHIPLTVSTDYMLGDFADRDPDSLFSVMWLHAGNAERKCAPELIRAVAKMREERPSVRLSIAGERGSATPALEALIAELHLQDTVELLGAISKAEKVERLQRCAVYLQPSRYEGFGMAILEAMACGAPVVTSAVGEVPHVVGDAGLYADGTDPDDIANAALSLLHDESLRRTLSEKGHQRAVTAFGAERRRDAFRDIVTQVL